MERDFPLGGIILINLCRRISNAEAVFIISNPEFTRHGMDRNLKKELCKSSWLAKNQDSFQAPKSKQPLALVDVPIYISG
jgi:hypothetical protein